MEHTSSIRNISKSYGMGRCSFVVGVQPNNNALGGASNA